jgi:CHASE2 domain-containing sensor protein
VTADENGKLVILKFDGSLQQGFRVLLEIGDEGDRPAIELAGALPPSPELASDLARWQHHYRSLRATSPSRIQPQQIIYGGSVNRLEECWHAATELHHQMTRWLESPSFRRLDLRLRESLNLTDPIRVLIRTQDPLLHRLPWHLWDFTERYAKTEIALSALVSERIEVEAAAVLTRSVKILAILGSSEDINIQADRQFLADLPDAKTTFLVEPSRADINQQLWQQPWDILFFAGHSSTEGDRGLISINPTESLSLEDLKYGLKQAISKGLQLAIFNSCDGLGLAQSLESLHLPQMIVMREPVPDRIAQAFLKAFLKAYSSGQSLYLSVREAREQLQSLETQFPCATWLPAICQNSAKIPPTWRALVEGRTSERFSHSATSDLSAQSAVLPLPPTADMVSGIAQRCVQYSRRLAHQIRSGWIVLLVSLMVTVGLSTPFSLSRMQPLELGIYDRMIRLRPYEGADDRLLIIGITDADIKAQKENGELLKRRSLSKQTYHQPFETSLSDQSLNRLLDKLAQYQPLVVGLDLYRDFAAAPDQSDLSARLKQHKELIAVCKAEDFEDLSIPSIDPPPEISINRVGFSDFREDSDRVLRRHLLGMLPLVRTQASRCNTDWSFSLQVAAQYLRSQQIETQFTEAGDLQFNHKTVKVLQSSGGTYPPNTGGSEIMLNYRATAEISPVVTLQQFLTQQINPDYLTGKIVLVGVTAQDGEDYWLTPIDPVVAMPGVVVQAHMISQLLSTALDNRSLLRTLSPLQQTGWIGTWAVIGGVLSFWRWQPKGRQRAKLLLSLSGAITFLYGLCFLGLLRGHWLPFISLVLALVLSSVLVTVYLCAHAAKPVGSTSV